MKNRLSSIFPGGLLFLGVLFLSAQPVFAQADVESAYVEVRPEPGEGIWSLLRRSGVSPNAESVAEFKTMNAGKFRNGTELRRDVTYRVPSRSLHVPLFGKDYATVPLKSDQLKGHVYYIVGGHGGPDPGTLGTYEGKQIAEDEIAYDTALRLARELMMDGATVYVIVQDPDDGIRDDTYLPVDHDEVYHGNKTIVLNQARRLRTRASVINELYDSHRKTALSQQVIALHVDSYGYRVEPQVDVHFIVGSRSGKSLARTVQSTIEDKYRYYQPDRGYKGEIKNRNLMILRETKPTAVLIELGNIRHKGDQHRLIKPSNRQTLAEWIKEGLVQEASGKGV
jgi:N-acetylmuramoyl-L-alanine amidase